jgi:hypothetical protein
VSGRLVFIPGFLDNAALWRGVIDRLAMPDWESVPVNLHSDRQEIPARPDRLVPDAGHWPHVEQPAAVAIILARSVRGITHSDMDAKR